MRIVHATHSLDGSTGVQTYLITVADEMQRTGHEVWLHSTRARQRRGIRRDAGPARGRRRRATCPTSIDAAIVHSSVASHELAAVRPDLPQVFIAHGSYFDMYVPPQIDGAVASVVTLWGGAAMRMAGLATEHPGRRRLPSPSTARASAIARRSARRPAAR